MGGEGFAIGDRHLEINPFEEIPVLTDANESPTLPTSSMINETTTIRPQLIQQYVDCIPNPEPSPAHTPPRAEPPCEYEYQTSKQTNNC
ncbi:unnamed protein product [Colias eurytheme]|nr:unnamed protein product [Colias eurytheme]